MRFLSVSICAVIMAFCFLSRVQAEEGSLGPTTFSDGSVAAAYDHCGDTDLCATVTYPGGDKLSIYSEGAAFCQPYILHFVRVNGSHTIYEYSRTINHDVVTQSAFGSHCGHSQATQMVLDHGLIHMTVTENHDGTLKIVFSPATPQP